MVPKVQTADSCFGLIWPRQCSAAQVDQQLLPTQHVYIELDPFVASIDDLYLYVELYR